MKNATKFPAGWDGHSDRFGCRHLLAPSRGHVVFAAVMSAIQPQLERISRRNTQPGDE